MKRVISFGLIIVAVIGVLVAPTARAEAYCEVQSEGALDGYISSHSATYPAAQIGAGLTVGTADSLMYVGQLKSAGFTIYRGYLSFDTSSIPDSATVLTAELTVAWVGDYSDKNFMVNVYSDNYGPTLTSADWRLGCSHYEGAIINTASYSTWHTMAVEPDYVSLTGDTQYWMRSSNDEECISPTSPPEYITLGTAAYVGFEPYLSITYSNTVYGYSTIGYNQTVCMPASQIIPHNYTAELREYRVNALASDWINVTAAENATYHMTYPAVNVTVWANTANLSGFSWFGVANEWISVWFFVPIEPMTVLHISMYAVNTYSDAPMQGYPWESWRVMITQGDWIPDGSSCPIQVPGATFDIWDSSIIPSPDYAVEQGHYYAVAVLDWYGNILAEQMVAANNGTTERFVTINVPAWELAITNQCDEDVYIQIFDSSNLSVPMTLQCPGHWSRFRYMRESDYTISATYLTGASTNTTVWFNTTIDSATTYRINGTGIFELLQLGDNIFTWQKVITQALTPGLIWLQDNPALVPSGTRGGVEDLVIDLDPYMVMWGSVHDFDSSATTATVVAWNSSGMPGTMTYLSDRVRAGVNKSATYYVNDTEAGWVYATATGLGGSYQLAGNASEGDELTLEATGVGTIGSIERDLEFRYAELFNWSYMPSLNRYRAAIQVHNGFDAALDIVNPQVYAAFWNDTADVETVTVFDSDNSIYLEPGANFVVDTTGVRFEFAGLAAGEYRNFTIQYYGRNSTSYAQMTLRLQNPERLLYQSPSDYRLYMQGKYQNYEPTTLNGDMLIMLDVSGDINPESVVVYDIDRGAEVPEDSWIMDGKSIRVDADWVGGVGPSSTRSFGVYYNVEAQSVVDDLLGSVYGVSVTLVLVVVGVIVALYGYTKGSSALISIGGLVAIVAVCAVVLSAIIAADAGRVAAPFIPYGEFAP